MEYMATLKSSPVSYVARILAVKRRNPNPHRLIRPNLGESHAASLCQSRVDHLSNFRLPKKYENAGLRANSKIKARPAASREDNTQSSLGGLDDEDAEAERPAMYPVKRSGTARLEFPINLQRDKTRKNEVSI